MLISIQKASELLKEGRVIAVATDTVFGLAALPSIPSALLEIFSMKKRPTTQTLPLLGHSLGSFDSFVSENPSELAAAFWPGALTIVLPAKEEIHPLLVENKSVAIRVPNHPLLLEVLKITGPLAVTSANISGELPLTSPAEIEAKWGADFPIFGTHSSPENIPSTIVKLEKGICSILRQGAIRESEILKVKGLEHV